MIQHFLLAMVGAGSRTLRSEYGTAYEKTRQTASLKVYIGHQPTKRGDLNWILPKWCVFFASCELLIFWLRNQVIYWNLAPPQWTPGVTQTAMENRPDSKVYFFGNVHRTHDGAIDNALYCWDCRNYSHYDSDRYQIRFCLVTLINYHLHVLGIVAIVGIMGIAVGSVVGNSTLSSPFSI